MGYTNTENKLYALGCILPFIYIPGIVFLASLYSQFWNEYPSMFLFGAGILITHVTGSFNLASSAKYKFNPFFIDVLVFCTLLYADYNQRMSREKLVIAYLSIIVVRSFLYIWFMAGMIR